MAVISGMSGTRKCGCKGLQADRSEGKVSRKGNLIARMGNREVE